MKTVTPRQLSRILDDMAISGGYPVMVWGAPGIGKSDIVKEVARRRNLEVLDMRLNYYEESDLLGIPMRTEEGMKFVKYSSFPSSGNGLWFFDELTHARTSIQGLVFELINDGKIEDYSVPDGWRHFVGASNLPRHRSISNPMPTGLSSRFTGGHYELIPDLSDWVSWANSKGVDERVIAFVSYMENSDSLPWLLRMDSDTMLNPRLWSTGISHSVKNFRGEHLESILGGLMGETNAAEFIRYLQQADGLPGYEEIMKEPEKWLSTEQDPSRIYLFLNSIIKNTAKGNISVDSSLEVISRIPHEFMAFALTALARSIKEDSLLSSRTFRKNIELFSEVLGLEG